MPSPSPAPGFVKYVSDLMNKVVEIQTKKSMDENELLPGGIAILER